MPQRKARVALQYAGRQVQVGETFEVEPAHVGPLVAMGKIEREDADEVPGYVARDMVAGWPNGYQTRDINVAARVKRTYTRRAAQ